MHCRLVTNWHFSLAEITGMCQYSKPVHVFQKLALGQVSEMVKFSPWNPTKVEGAHHSIGFCVHHM